ncbi:MAG: peptide chain release factor 2 [Candidatus Komeilibacteria bacterium CG11_big_fil_rev_8_21_14_0_20_36_20]|uniref:Peptide chain release factor 2 n=1 Tax=Candidatus Komeilibacteria bacterium CG11_big_fil_rev_8_21_14_0_20_36_20 TaxID=1974477 RepID=A0A2H0NDS7_9BACT|nr:MAG: peptide chain release factor 2 [Candidatus Komeilibacteria bacterium CG11_big_fil_rev_8_21_14_0_20_36_20]PIR81421.1 MAG: peptide chain release factor 2 [Candidatus Komeilibacteria bacterium CG10_big_fil_rev_8_21_14_0_10_36_65]PJC55147.1 MAG: peptide chain release factor 2 [Candidatus Komeilibacteria bacterium CG_4_9_14_0_2_um_filter_36_13]
MEELRVKIKDLVFQINQSILDLKIIGKEKKLEDLSQQMSVADFWHNQDQAKAVSTVASQLEQDINNWRNLEEQIKNLDNLSQDPQAEELLGDLNQDFENIKNIFEKLSEQLLFKDKYDHLPAIVTIKAGAGGDDAQDWAQMLERMYLRFAEQNNWTVKYLSRSPGAEAGIKSATFKVSGPQVYGYLKNEKGVHRLVRLSPFDADQARHTSFAMVEVLPELTETGIDIKEGELKVDTFRASGHGGQSVNTTDSAVRLTHLPTGLTAVCQNERSQLQNKKQALAYLKSKLQRYHEVEQDDEKKALKGEYTEAAWGNQIRSYVLHPYKMVKDHRTNYESDNPQRVLDGGIIDFIQAKLKEGATKN